ncbi:MAG: E3 binding domain-containing protein, partial [Thermomicrobiaceae bacterium]|nr:E3 binding domain-containing protein [Thermomicrobiaceae bacterium]
MSTTSRGTQVRLPKLGESVTEGTIGAWLKRVGDRVEKYEPLVEITTDKVNAEVPSPVSGVITQIVAQEGETLPVGAELCVIEESGGATARPAAPNGAAAAETAPAPAVPDGQRAAASAPARGPREFSEASAMELLRQRSSPAVRRIAEEHGIDISRIKGTGIGGRVTKHDILRYIAEGAP